MKKIVVLVSLVWVNKFCAAQTLEELNSDRVETLAQSENVERDLSEVEEQRSFLLKNPIDLNYSSPFELLNTGLFDELQVIALCKHRIQCGRLIAIEELQVIDGFNSLFIFAITPYVRLGQPLVDEKFKLSTLLDKGRHQIIFRAQRTLETQEGFVPNESGYKTYNGDPWKIFSRYKFTAGKYFSIGITGEKDAGEELFKGSQASGFDFYSAHLFIRPNRFLKTIAIGDYQVQYGQGLVVWNGIAFGKGAETILIKRQGSGINPYSSASETGFYRGIASSFGGQNTKVDVWLSNRRLDASFFPIDTLFNEFEVSAINESGLHRSYDELNKKANLQQRIIGSHIGTIINEFKIGYTVQYMDFSTKLFKGDDIYEYYDANGKRFFNHGVDYSFNYRNFYFFGEIASDKESNFGYINGCILGLDRKFNVSILHRKYAKNFNSLTANAFREGTRVTNEIGTYIGLQWVFNKQIKWNSYIDVFRFPWLRYQVNLPSGGYEYLTQMTYTPLRTTEVILRYRYQQKEINDPLHTNRIDNLVANKQSNIRFQVKFKVNTNWILQSRIEQVVVSDFESKNGKAYGSAFFQDIQYKPLGKPLSIAVRYSIFQTKDYDTRIYSYEQDMPGSYSIPSLYYGGQRIYLMIHYRLFKGYDIWLRGGRSVFPNIESIGTAFDQINANHRTEIKFQLRLTF